MLDPLPPHGRALWDGSIAIAPQATPGSALRGSVVFAEPGVMVWSRKRGRGGMGVDWRPEEPLGGVLLALDEGFDPETGEVRRQYRTLSPYGNRLDYAVLDETEVGESSFEPVNDGRCRKLLRRLCEEIAYSDRGKRRTGPYLPEHSRMLHDALILDRVLLGPEVRR
jgi:hypothetical protein